MVSDVSIFRKFFCQLCETLLRLRYTYEGKFYHRLLTLCFSRVPSQFSCFPKFYCSEILFLHSGFIASWCSHDLISSVRAFQLSFFLVPRRSSMLYQINFSRLRMENFLIMECNTILAYTSFPFAKVLRSAVSPLCLDLLINKNLKVIDDSVHFGVFSSLSIFFQF